MAELHDRRDAAGASGTFRDQQRPYRLDIAAAIFRSSPGPARQRGAGRFDRVELVALAVPSSFLTVRTINLDHRDPGRSEVSRQARTIRTGPFDPDPIDRPEPSHPRRQGCIPCAVDRERRDTKHAADRIDDGSDMHIKVRVDTTHNRAR